MQVFIAIFITETEIDAYGDEYDEYDPNDIPIEQRAPEGYGAPPPAPDYELPDYEVPDYEAPAEEEVVDIKAVEEEVPVEVEGKHFLTPFFVKIPKFKFAQTGKVGI